jgi:hypothetical protein
MKKIIEQIKKLTKGYSTLNIGEDTFRDSICLNTKEHIEGGNGVYIYAISKNEVNCEVVRDYAETIYFSLPFEVLSIEVLREVLENVKEAHAFSQS